MNSTLSTFKNAFAQIPDGTITLAQLGEDIRTGRWRKQVEWLRAMPDEKYQLEKRKLPAVTLSAALKTRDANLPIEDRLISHSGLLQIDIDKVADLDELRSKINRDPHTLMSFTSPSGCGLKIVCRIDGTRHAESFLAAERYYRDRYGLQVDRSVKDIGRICFVSFDPNIFVNQSAVPFEILDEPKPAPQSQNQGHRSDFGGRACDQAQRMIADAVDGQKHAALFKAAFLLGGYVAGGMLSENEARAVLLAAIEGKPNVRDKRGALKTIDDGLKAGQKEPIGREQLERERMEWEKKRKQEPKKEAKPEKGSKEPKKEARESRESCGSGDEARGKQEGPNWEAINDEEEERAVRGLTGPIRKWIMESRGSFTTADIDREFCLNTRTEKNRRSRVLHDLLYKEKKILKDFNNRRGVWHVVEDSPEWVDLDTESTSSFPLQLPLGLDNMVSLPPKSIVVIGGQTNAGKTALMLDIAALNVQQHTGKMVYMFSEMGHGEFKKRLRDRSDVPYEQWKGMRSLEGLRDYGGIVNRHNPDGISFVDYLEEVDGEYSKLASQIRRVYDCLRDGVCVIGLQKNSNNTYAKGGEGTAEKARLYLTMDLLLQIDGGSIASIKVLKAKAYPGRNPNGLEIHAKVNGRGLTPLMKQWERMDSKRRDSLVAQYQLAFSKG
jgi:hypothetical protein